MDKRSKEVSQDFLAWRRRSPYIDSFQLYAGRRPLATLMIGGLMTTTAQLDVDDYHVIFVTEGIGIYRIAISETGGERLLLAKFDGRRSWQRGTLRLAEGGQHEWHRVGWWRPAYVFADRFGNRVVRFHPEGTVTGDCIDRHLNPKESSQRDLMLLLGLGWFLLIIGGSAIVPHSVAVLP